MSTDRLATYLNDHLVGSVLALELVDHLMAQESGTPLGQALTQLRREIGADQDTLRDLLRRLGAGEGVLGKAAAWLTEKVSRIKLSPSGDTNRALALVEALETLALGIHGKLALWRALADVAGVDARLRGVDFARLERRAREQHDRVEGWRLDAARAAFASEE